MSEKFNRNKIEPMQLPFYKTLLSGHFFSEKAHFFSEKALHVIMQLSSILAHFKRVHVCVMGMGLK